MKPVNAHLTLKQDRTPSGTWSQRSDSRAIAGLRRDHAAAHRRLHADAVRHRLYRQQYRHRYRPLPTIYLVTGLCTVFVGPLVGRASDSFGKFNTFCFGSAVTIVMVLIYTHLGRCAPS